MRDLRDRLAGFGYGGDYNPEQWSPQVWAEDMALMREAGVNLVTLGIFSWAMVEPAPGRYAWAWFDRVMDLLAENGIAVCLATMTASPPPWMARAHPETLPVTADGTVLGPGARQHYTPSSPVYRRYATRLVEALATRYAAHPALAAWHVGNEFGCHVAESYGEVDAVAFRTWLRERYGDLDALNTAWSTAFWSQRYGDWAQVQPPRAAPTFGNPMQRVDFRRFSSDALLACYRAERDVLRRVTPDVPITTNFFAPDKPVVDWQDWAEEEDVVSFDAYPDPADPRSHVTFAYIYDLLRSLKGGMPWLLLEQAPSAVNWRAVNRPKAPGRMRLGSWQAVARGADSVLFFQWRASRGGAEKFHSAMLPHAGPRSRTFAEVRELGRELAGAAEIAGTRVTAEAALVLDWPSWWALEQPSHPSTLLRQSEANRTHYAPLWHAGVTCDVVRPSADLSAYRVVVVPNLYLLDADVGENLAGFVRSGGHLVVSFFSGVADGHDRIHPGGPPGPLAEVLGLGVTEFWPLGKGEHVDLAWTSEPERSAGGAARGTLWSEEIRLAGASPLAAFGSGGAAGHAAVTVNAYGAGRAYYLATRPDPASMAAFLDGVCRAAGVGPVWPGLPAGVEAVRRGRYVVLLNHAAEAHDICVPDAESAATDLAGNRVYPVFTLAEADVRVIRSV